MKNISLRELLRELEKSIPAYGDEEIISIGTSCGNNNSQYKFYTKEGNVICVNCYKTKQRNS